MLPNLKKLDNEEITMEEKQTAASMQFDDEDLSMMNASPMSVSNPEPPKAPEIPQPVYESPPKQPMYEHSEMMQPRPGGLQRTPPKMMREEEKYQQYQAMPDPTPQAMPQQTTPEPWSKGGAAEMYVGGMPPQYNMPGHEMQRPQTSQPYYQELPPPLRYDLNDTGKYVPPSHPKLQHAHSTPVGAGMGGGPGLNPGAANGGKYKNENIL